MLATLFFWVYTLSIGYCYGWGTTQLLVWMFKLERGGYHFSITWLLGVSVMTTMGAFFSIFMPLSWLAQLIILVGAVLIIVWGLRRGILPSRKVIRGQYPLKPAAWLLLILILCSALVLSIGKAANPDTGIYHAQAIRWMESYPAIPGLGNLHSRLAYNSNWLLANALFSFSFLGLRSFHLMGSVLFLVSLWYFFIGINDLLNGSTRPSHMIRLIYLPLAYLIIGADVSSPGTDLPAALLAWVILTETMAIKEDEQMTRTIRPLILVLLACFAVTVKLASVPLLLLAFYPLLFFLRERKLKSIFVLLGLGSVIIIPWLWRNVILSGYLIYPFPQIDLFNLNWKVPEAIATLDRDTIRAWALPRLPGQTDADILAMTMRRWVPRWFEYLTLNRKAIIAIIGLAPLGYLIAGLVSRKLRAQLILFLKHYATVYTIAYIGVLYWFFTAPLFRYGYNFTISVLALALLPILMLVDRWFNLKTVRSSIVIITLLIGFEGWVFYRIIDFDVIRRNALLPADYPTVPTHPCELQNATVWCAEEWDACWYEAFPCIPAADPMVAMRGESLRQGFMNIDDKGES
jgi:hypothetical protein